MHCIVRYCTSLCCTVCTVLWGLQDLATADTLLLREVPAEGNKEAVSVLPAPWLPRAIQYSSMTVQHSTARKL